MLSSGVDIKRGSPIQTLVLHLSTCHILHLPVPYLHISYHTNFTYFRLQGLNLGVICRLKIPLLRNIVFDLLEYNSAYLTNNNVCQFFLSFSEKRNINIDREPRLRGGECDRKHYHYDIHFMAI